MNTARFIASRIFRSEDGSQQISRPAVSIATIGIAIGLAVMIVTVSVVTGFKHTIRDKAVGFGSHIQVTSLAQQQSAIPTPIVVGDTLLAALRQTDNVSHAARYATAQGILKTDSDFMGVAFKGIAADYDTTFLCRCLTEGRMPRVGGAAVRYELLVSHKMASQLQLHVGDRIHAYFIAADDVRARRFTITGIYKSDLKMFDDAMCFTDFRIPQKINGWEPDQCSGVEMLVGDFDRIDETADRVAGAVNLLTDRYGQTLSAQTIGEAIPQLFSWLSLLDVNVWIILALMACVAGITMVSGLLIIILERTQMIGLLKALGARNTLVRRTFLWLATFIIGRGLVWGNIIGIGLVLLQQHTGFVRLDPDSYYVETAPMELHLEVVLLLNVATLAVTIMVLLAPSYLASRVNPARTMQFE